MCCGTGQWSEADVQQTLRHLQPSDRRTMPRYTLEDIVTADNDGGGVCEPSG